MFHVEPSPASVIAQAAALGVDLGPHQAERLLEHLHLLQKWNRTHNLVGPGDIDGWLARHTLDSLAPVPYLPVGRGFDVGSGAGFPGIPIAVARPDCQLTLCEPRQKRLAFLRTVVAALQLPSVDLRVSPVSPTAPPEGANFVLSRATFLLPAWLALGARLLAPGGILVAFLGVDPWADERLRVEGGNHGLLLQHLRHYAVGDGPERAIAVFQKGRAGVPRGTPGGGPPRSEP